MSLKLNERYPGRFTNPSADYPLGSFKNRTSPTAKDGSYLEKDWANDKEGFFQSLLSAVGVAANGLIDKVGASQVFDALLRIGQSQTGKAFSTGGSAPALTLTPSPAVAAYALGLRFQVTFSTAGGGAPTLNISGLGAKNLMQYSSSGAKVVANTVAGQVADVVYDGTDLVIVNPVNTIPQATSSTVGVSRFATQTEVNNSSAPDVAVAPNTLGVLLTNYTKQATTTALGMAKIATQALVNAGVDAITFVTPATLRFGVIYSLTLQGYVVFPSWLGGFAIQWGSVASAGTVNFPTAFTAAYIAIASSNVNGNYTSTGSLTTTSFVLSNSGNQAMTWLALGRV